MNLLQLYRSILESVGLTVDDKGSVYMEEVAGLLPAMITVGPKTQRALQLPTDEFLRDPDWDNYVAFHPLSENLARKDSRVFKWLQAMAVLSVDTELAWVMETLITTCADKDNHDKLNFKQTAFLNLFPNADEKSVETWRKLIDKTGDEYCFCKLVTLRNRDLNGQPFTRVTMVKFPFYQECLNLVNGNAKEFNIFGVKMRKKDLLGYKALFEYVIKHVNDVDKHYSAGTRSTVAPSFVSLMTAYLHVKKDIQKVARLLKLETPDLKWGAELEDISRFRNDVAPLAHNEGELTEGERRESKMNISAPSVPQAVQQPVGVVAAVAAPKNNNTVIPMPVRTPAGAPQAIAQPQPAATPKPTPVAHTPATGAKFKILPTDAERQAQAQANGNAQPAPVTTTTQPQPTAIVYQQGPNGTLIPVAVPVSGTAAPVVAMPNNVAPMVVSNTMTPMGMPAPVMGGMVNTGGNPLLSNLNPSNPNQPMMVGEPMMTAHTQVRSTPVAATGYVNAIPVTNNGYGYGTPMMAPAGYVNAMPVGNTVYYR
nr:MAG TPA: hypothetical protein [Caudoviricetes sp.]